MGGQPCTGGKVTPEEKITMVPPIEQVGSYRLFLVKDSNWPFEYIQYTPSISVVDDLTKCPGEIKRVAPPIIKNVVFIDDGTLAPTSTSSYPSSWTTSSTGTSTSTIASSYWTSSSFNDDFFGDDFSGDDFFGGLFGG